MMKRSAVLIVAGLLSGCATMPTPSHVATVQAPPHRARPPVARREAAPVVVPVPILAPTPAATPEPAGWRLKWFH